PQWVIGWVVERDERGYGIPGEQNAAGQTGFSHPFHLGHRVIHVVEEDLPHAGAAAGHLVAEVDEPAVVGPQARPAPLVLRSRPGYADGEDAAGEERWGRVWEQDLADDALRLDGLLAFRAVPAQGRVLGGDTGLDVGFLEGGPRVGERGGPAVELLVPFLLEIVLVGEDGCARMAVGRDDDVVVWRVHRAGQLPLGEGSGRFSGSGLGGKTAEFRVSFRDGREPQDLRGAGELGGEDGPQRLDPLALHVAGKSAGVGPLLDHDEADGRVFGAVSLTSWVLRAQQGVDLAGAGLPARHAGGGEGGRHRLLGKGGRVDERLADLLDGRPDAVGDRLQRRQVERVDRRCGRPEHEADL